MLNLEMKDIRKNKEEEGLEDGQEELNKIWKIKLEQNMADSRKHMKEDLSMVRKNFLFNNKLNL